MESERVRLRSLEPEDQEFLERLCRDPAVRQYLGGPVPEAEIPTKLARYLGHAKTESHFLVEGIDFGESLGLISLHPARRTGWEEISYQFLPEFWGQGLASEALALLLREPRSLPLLAETQTKNSRSIHLLEKLGFEKLEEVKRFGEMQSIFEYRG